MMIRLAAPRDVAAITEIYNWAIKNTIATFDTEPKSIENRTDWLKQHSQKYPVIVAELEGDIIAWASLNLWSDKKAYADTVENSIYVREKNQGQGIGKKLLAELIKRARQNGIHVILARISDGNKNSIHIHKLMGFECVGVLKEVGRKFNRLIDVHLYQLILSTK